MTYTEQFNYRALSPGLSPTAAVYAADKTTVIAGQSAVPLSEFPAGKSNYSAQLTLGESGGYIVVTDGPDAEVLAYGPQSLSSNPIIR